METKTKEFVWTAKLSKENKTMKWNGREDGALEQIILKLAVLGPGASKEERNLVEITTFDSEQNKTKACICALTGGKKENHNLGDLSLFPPAIFTLVEGKGPVHIVANHVMLDEDDFSDEEDMSDYEEQMEDLREKLKAQRKAAGKGDASAKPQKAAKKDEVDEDDDVDDEEEKVTSPSKKKKANVPILMEAGESDDDDDDDEDLADMEDDDDEEEDEDEEEEEAPPKKRKIMNGKAAKQEKKDAPEKKVMSPSRGNKNVPEQKTPKTQKDAEQKTPKSEKKTPAKPKFNTVEEVKAAIQKFPGGKPRKQDKFCNWVQNTFKVAEESWKTDLWKWHKKELGL